MTMRLFCIIGIAICALLWYPAFHYQGVFQVLGVTFLGMAVMATFLEKSNPPVPSKK